MLEWIFPEVPKETTKVDSTRFQSIDEVAVLNFVLQHDKINIQKKNRRSHQALTTVLKPMSARHFQIST